MAAPMGSHLSKMPFLLGNCRKLIISPTFQMRQVIWSGFNRENNPVVSCVFCQRCLKSTWSDPNKPQKPEKPGPIRPPASKPLRPEIEKPEQEDKLSPLEDKVRPPLRPWRYFMDRMANFVSTSTDKLEKKAPKAFQVYRTFRTGLSLFVTDARDFPKVSIRLWNGDSMTDFSRRDLELYRQFSSDLPLVGLLLLIAFAPGGVLIFPLAYTFPRFLLSHHFWTSEQREQFEKIRITKQVKHYNSIMDHLLLLSRYIDDDQQEKALKEAVKKLDLSVQLTNEEILHLKPLFEGKPYKVDSLSIRHVRHLSKSLALSVRRQRLVKDGLLLHYIDMAMVREGLDGLRDNDLNRACEWRGLNPQGLRRHEKVAYLNRWLHISSHIHESSISLLLHLPVLLSFCSHTNREIMGPISGRKRGQIS